LVPPAEVTLPQITDEIILCELIKHYNPADRGHAVALASWATVCSATSHVAKEQIFGDVWLHHITAYSQNIAQQDSQKRISVPEFNHRVRHRHPMMTLIHTIRIQLPWFITFQGEANIERAL
jgi:hypothetical protein